MSPPAPGTGRDGQLTGLPRGQTVKCRGGVAHAPVGGPRVGCVTAVTPTTPIDREDLYRFSRSVDDVLDNLRDLVRETDLLGMPGDPADLPALDAVREGLTALREAASHLVDDPRRVQRHAMAARKAAGRVRREYQEAVAALFREELSSTMLRRRELLRRLDVIGLRLNAAAADLSDALLKRGY
ncbi:hypothetical protein V2W30_00835 [Streptomyces sp. Q6]|uniref:Uncharacterized protein n=1 Tax=Streptomyces citrinus TaxID=3118173 RepID=A0ACD5A4G1_9ACTN